MSVMLDIAESIVPGRYGLVAVVQVYFDESENDNRSKLCIGGYVYFKSKLRQFEQAWRLLLLHYEVPYLRMSGCAHGNPPFDKLSPPKRARLAKSAIELIKTFAAFGVTVTREPEEFARLVQPNEYFTTPYELCIWHCLMSVKAWADNNFQRARIAYFFESGHRHQKRANALMDEIFKDARLREYCRYEGHAFVRKESSAAVQSADLIAWQLLKNWKRQEEGLGPRKDYSSLLELTHTIVRPREDVLLQCDEMVTELKAKRTPPPRRPLRKE
jgi:hypothetical protein